MSKGTLIRAVVLLVALINQSLVLAGYSPLPFDDVQVENFTAAVFTIVASIWSWWKNNSITRNAKKADEYLKELKK